MDKPGVRGDISLFDDLLEGRWPEVSVSNVTGAGFDVLGRRTFEAHPRLQQATGQTCGPRQAVHFAPGLEGERHGPRDSQGDIGGLQVRHRIWGAQFFDGQKVTGDHVLEEGDVVEIHI